MELLQSKSHIQMREAGCTDGECVTYNNVNFTVDNWQNRTL